MKVTLAALADYANVTAEGKLNIMGIFDAITSPSVPLFQSGARLIVRFQTEPAERGTTKVIEYKLLNADGRVLLAHSQSLAIAESAPLRAAIPLITVINGVLLETYGDYAFHILVNGETKTTVEFQVVKPPASPPESSFPSDEGGGD